jgi:hypothetical protein
LNIIRNHQGKSGLIQNLLHTEEWSENIRDKLTGDIIWKLGESQNRTMLRVLVPSSAILISQENLSGKIKLVNYGNDNRFKILEIPLFVGFGERLITKIVYDTSMESYNNKPVNYSFKILATPGKNQAEILTTITPQNNYNITNIAGKSLGEYAPLIDNQYNVQLGK